MEAEPPWIVAQAVGPAILWSSFKAGTFTGVVGLSAGGVAGLIRSTTPTLFAVASGIQCFALGSTFWGARQSILVYEARRRGMDVLALDSRQRREASTIAGGMSGATVAALFRGPSNILPGTIVFAIFGFLGQSLYNRLDSRHTRNEQLPSTESMWRRIANSKYSPMKILSDEQYENMLKEKLIRVEAEIALIDENIEKVKAEDKQTPDTTSE